MRFDSNPSTVDHLRTVLAKDPRVLRTGMVKLEGSGKHTGTLRGMANISDIVWSRRTQGMSSVKKQDAGGLVAGYSNP